MSNAIKYNRNGGKIRISYISQPSGRIRVLISDTGSGILEDDLPILFEPFSRLYLKSDAQEGAGIGLSFSKQLIELMGGTIGVESTIGKGSTFWFELDESRQPEEPAEDNAAHRVQQPKGMPLKGEHTVLYVEDSPSHIRLMKAIIDKMPGIHLITAHTPKLGIELAMAQRPDLIVLDICLPGMDGFEVLGALRADSRTQSTPVIAISASAMPNEVEKGLRAGFRRYMTKPIQIAKFERIVEELLLDEARLRDRH